MPAADSARSAPPDAITLGTAFDRLDLSTRSTVIAAVSGGSDSTALLVSFHDFLKRRPLPPRLVAATVDHGLRVESEDEARAVADLCVALGIEHRALRWDGDKPASGIAAAARDARYRLLGACALAEGVGLVLTGHTAEDQAETVAMRLKRGEGRGLAGIAPATLWRNQVWFARPLLGLRRAALQDFLRARDIGWVSDPSNVDRRFERARVRQDQAAEIDSVLHIGEEASAERAALSQAAARLIAAVVRRDDETVQLPRQMFDASPASLLAFRLLLATLGERRHLPDEARAGQVLRDAGSASTLGGVIVSARGGDIVLKREKRADLSRTPGGPFGELLPSFDLPVARAVAVLFGRPAIPEAPWRK